LARRPTTCEQAADTTVMCGGPHPPSAQQRPFGLPTDSTSMSRATVKPRSPQPHGLPKPSFFYSVFGAHGPLRPRPPPRSSYSIYEEPHEDTHPLYVVGPRGWLSVSHRARRGRAEHEARRRRPTAECPPHRHAALQLGMWHWATSRICAAALTTCASLCSRRATERATAAVTQA